MLKIVDNYTLNEYLGKGEYGKVYKATNIDTKFEVAIKMIPLSKFEEISRLVDLTRNEIGILKILEDNINVINFVEMIKTNNYIYLVYEYCEGGTLEDTILKAGPIPEKEALKIFKQLINAFKALNSHHILHRDVKPNNIFFKLGHLKLADFGFCKQLKNYDDFTQTSLGSPLYMAPEVLNGDVYGSKADLWSVGVVLYEMLFGKCPYGECNIKQLINIYNNEKSKIPIHEGSVSISPATENMLRRILEKDQFKRISWQDFFYQYSIDEYGSLVKKEKDFEYDLMKLIKRNSSSGLKPKAPQDVQSNRKSKIDWSKITEKNSSIHSEQLNPIDHQDAGSIDQLMNLKKKVKELELQHEKRVQLSGIIEQMLGSPKDYYFSSTICYFLICNLERTIRQTLPELQCFIDEHRQLLNSNANQSNTVNKMIVVFRNEATSLKTKINSIKINLINSPDFQFRIVKYPNQQIRQNQTNAYVKSFQAKNPGITDLTTDSQQVPRESAIFLARVLWGVAVIQHTFRKDKQLNVLAIKPETPTKQVIKLINRLIVFLNS